MIYFSPQGRTPKPITRSPYWGQMFTPKNGVTHPVCRVWCADNQAYSGHFNWTRYYDWLRAMHPYRATCLFATVPDVIADAQATLDQFARYAPAIEDLGFRIALVAQDGLESLPWPHPDTYTCLFIGGTTAWKLSDHAAWCIAEALRLGKWVHVGRVNSQKRIRHFRALGAHSADGTYIAFNPDEGYRRLHKALTEVPPTDVLGALAARRGTKEADVPL